MRIGVNPEKANSRKLVYKAHRIIIPIYIPDGDHIYFKNSFLVLQECIKSILNSIDIDKTAISILNNSSKKQVLNYIQNLIQLKKIDKHVQYSENMGKVYAVLQEARSSHEEFITICDADVFFFKGWQNEVLSVFKDFKNIGVVGATPDVNLAFYCNNSLFYRNFFVIKHGKIVQEEELLLFEKGINNKDFFISKNKNWKSKQYYLKVKDKKVVIGAAHFASTYRSYLFKNLPFVNPIYVFPGGEHDFIDKPIDLLGLGRVSLTKAFAYHMGNTIPSWLDSEDREKAVLINVDMNKIVISNIIPYRFKRLVVTLLKKFYYKI